MKHPDYPGVSSMKDRHGKQRWRFRKSGHRDVMLPGQPHSPAFNALYSEILETIAEGKEWEREKPAAPYRTNPQGIRGNFPRRIERMLISLRVRSASLRREFDLTQEWLIAELERCDYRCSLTGIPFEADHDTSTRANPRAPSIDRIDCRRGYTVDNVRLVLVAVNLALSDFGLDLFDEICRARVMKLLSER